MEPILAEFAKYGLIALSFGVLLVFTLRDKSNMATEMKEDKQKLVDALTGMSAVVANNTTMLSEIKQVIQSCTRTHRADDRGGLS